MLCYVMQSHPTLSAEKNRQLNPSSNRSSSSSTTANDDDDHLNSEEEEDEEEEEEGGVGRRADAAYEQIPTNAPLGTDIGDPPG